MVRDRVKFLVAPKEYSKLDDIEEIFFWRREVLLILNNYIKIIQSYKIQPGLCITKMHTAYEKETKKRTTWPK